MLLSENIPLTKANYKLPARFSPTELKIMVFNLTVDAHWMKHSNRFWYSWETPEGKTYYIVNPEKAVKRPLFDNVKMAAQITKFTKDPYDAKHLPIKGLRFIKKDKIIYFKVKKNKNVLEAEKRAEEQKKKEEEKKEEVKVVDKEKKEEKKNLKEKGAIMARSSRQEIAGCAGQRWRRSGLRSERTLTSSVITRG